jgi:hypothetical protein
MLSCCSSLSSSISRSSAFSISFLRSSFADTPVGISTCLTAISRPRLASMPRKTEPNEPDPINAPLIHLNDLLPARLE